jgi:glutamate 5-kinase
VAKKPRSEGALKYERIVVKLGTNVLTSGSDRLDTELMARIVAQVAHLRSRGAEVLVVTSGAIAAGRHRLGLSDAKRKDIPFRQVLAAVGQSDLMQAYQALFKEHDVTVAQTLLTRQDLADRLGYLNARNALLAMLDLGVVPIINENDVVASDEIEGAKIGDNDNLSALVANLVDADMLALLTDIGGLFSADPRTSSNAELIPCVDRIDASVEALAGKTQSERSVGGMITKIQAAKLATGGGTDMYIVAGKEQDVLVRLASGEQIGTYFPAGTSRMESRKRWMLAGLSVRGTIVVDEGAAKVLRERKTSLLPAGVREVQGSFARGDAIAIAGPDGRIAVGIANYNADEIASIKGMRSDRIEETLGHNYGSEVVHRDNLVLM